MEPKNLLERLEQMIHIAHETNCILTKIATPDAEKILELLIAVSDVEEMIAGLPTVDAVPVVRCGECGKYKMLSNDQTQVLCRGVWHGKNWYCADGEREE